ncbi:hypothetical protein PsorP6_015573 [Peronosclerospora sorghi]|uniref:Uncharacterized protein n=1 Tax=Peronosclerospora sorghi TaxID=230839 RepID=A0ACC0WQU1_9STRA|nr:hypothetical protein PsorP6_015573 [Peronosclerospora sorghi]
MKPYLESTKLLITFSHNGTRFPRLYCVLQRAVSSSSLSMSRRFFTSLERSGVTRSRTARDCTGWIYSIGGMNSPASGHCSGAAFFRTGAVTPTRDKHSVGCLVGLEASNDNAHRIGLHDTTGTYVGSSMFS